MATPLLASPVSPLHPSLNSVMVTGDTGEGNSERGSEGGLDSLSQGGSNRKGLLVVVRLSEVGLIGEKGTKVPNTSIAEISLEVELSLTFKFDYSRSVNLSFSAK